MYSDEASLKERDDKLYNLYKTGFYTDVILQVHGDVIGVHGVVLGSVSEYFQVMLQSSFRESSTKTINFSSSFEDMAVLKLVVDYMYTGKVTLRRRTLEQVLGAAHLFMLYSLKEHCAQFLLEQLQPQNSLWTWKLAYLYEMKELETVCRALLSVVFTREVVDQTDLGGFTPNCITELLDHEELMKNARHEDVSYLIVAWMNSGEFESRKIIAKSLLLKYLNDQALDVILQSVQGLTNSYSVPTCSQLSSNIPDFNGKISWSRTIEPVEQVTSPVDKSAPQPKFYGVLVQESYCNGMSLYCAKNKKWSFETFNRVGEIPIGIVDSNYIASLGKDIYNITLTNMSTRVSETPPSVLRAVMREGRIVNPCKEATHYFCHVGRLYVIMNSWVRSNAGLVLSLYQFDVVTNWSLLLDIDQELNNQYFQGPVPKDDYSVKLHSITAEGNEVFIIARISQKCTSISTTTSTLSTTTTMSCGETPKQPKSVIYLYRVNTSKCENKLLSTKCIHLTNTQLDQAILLNKKLYFLEKLKEIHEWGISDSASQCLLAKSICYDLEVDEWTEEEISIPIPNVEHLPLQNQWNFPRSSVKICGTKLCAGIHLSPHLFHVYQFDFETFQWTKLPNIPSPSVSDMTIHPVCVSRPLSRFVRGENSHKQIATSGFLFMNSLLESWKGVKPK